MVGQWGQQAGSPCLRDVSIANGRYTFHMKRALIALGAGAALIVAAFAIVYAMSGDEPPVQSPDGVPFPIATPGVGGGTTMLDLASTDGTPLAVQNFIENGTTIADPQNPGTYIVAGELGYCLEGGTCPSTGVQDFTISYFSEEQAFMIGLGAEPLGAVRDRAEQALADTLGIARAQLCQLRVSVGTTVYVNERYGALGELGVSGCPGAVPLPQ